MAENITREALAVAIFDAAKVMAGYDGHVMTLYEARQYAAHAEDVARAYRQADAVIALRPDAPADAARSGADREALFEAAPLPWTASAAAHGDPANGPDHHVVRDANGATVVETDYSEFGWMVAEFLAAQPATPDPFPDPVERQRIGSDWAPVDLDGLIVADANASTPLNPSLPRPISRPALEWDAERQQRREAAVYWVDEVAARPGVDREALAAEHARVRRGREFTHHRYDADPPQPTDYIAADVTAAVLAAQPTTPAPVDGDAVERAARETYTGDSEIGLLSRQGFVAGAAWALAAARADAPSVTGEQVAARFMEGHRPFPCTSNPHDAVQEVCAADDEPWPCERARITSSLGITVEGGAERG